MREMTQMVKSIYTMMGLTKELVEHHESAWDRAKEIFVRMDKNEDGKVTREEFIQTCLSDLGLFEILTPNACNYLGSFDTEPNK